MLNSFHERIMEAYHSNLAAEAIRVLNKSDIFCLNFIFPEGQE